MRWGKIRTHEKVGDALATHLFTSLECSYDIVYCEYFFRHRPSLYFLHPGVYGLDGIDRVALLMELNTRFLLDVNRPLFGFQGLLGPILFDLHMTSQISV